MPLIRKDLTGAAPPDPRGLPDILRSGTAEQRWRAARALGLAAGSETDSSAAVADGTKLLAEALKTEAELRVQEAIFTSLVRIGTREAVDAVIPCLRGDDAALRIGALDALRAMIGSVRAVLPTLLADPDADIRLLVCDLARELPTDDATKLLCDVLSREHEVNVCSAAVDVLADVGGIEALPVLRAMADRFSAETFLMFAVKVAEERILAEHAARPG